MTKKKEARIEAGLRNMKNIRPNHQLSPLGLTKPSPHNGKLRSALLDHGKGIMHYSLEHDREQGGGALVIRVSLHSSDGLDAYYFDIEDYHIRQMADMVGALEHNQKKNPEGCADQ